MGMPFFYSPYRYGNLYIDFDIIFTEKFDSGEVQKISEIWKYEKLNKNGNSMTDDKEESYFLTDYRIEDENTHHKGGKGTGKDEHGHGNGDEEDEEEPGVHRGQQTMNCAHQ